MITYQEEVVSEDLYDECEPLFIKNKEEINNLNSSLKVNPLEYVRAYRLGGFLFFSVREEGKIVGYSGYQISNHSQDGVKTASQHLLYILPEYRKGTVGIKLIKFCEDQMKLKRIKRIFQHTSKFRDLSKLFQRLGYTECEITYSKEL